jgi:rhamnosyltransferase
MVRQKQIGGEQVWGEWMIANNVCGVVVTFRPRLEDLANLGKLRRQVGGLIVVDNNSSEEKRVLLRSAARELEFTLIENGQNKGIAAALNTGVTWARAQGYNWAALFDQDSTPPPDFIDTMLRSYYRSSRRDRIALLVPRYIDSRLGTPLPAYYAKDGGLQVAMTSGSLIPVSTFINQGLFEECLFIDGVDYEYCLRLRGNGYSIEECSEAVLLHAPAHFVECKVHGVRLFSTSNYSAGRRYYRDRNKIWLMKQYWGRFPGFFVRTLFNTLKDACKIVLAEKNKTQKLYHMGLGVCDGMLGRMGNTVKL